MEKNIEKKLKEFAKMLGGKLIKYGKGDFAIDIYNDNSYAFLFNKEGKFKGLRIWNKETTEVTKDIIK